ncbi:MAG: thioredoxin family protein [Dehalococcoidia bacterium]
MQEDEATMVQQASVVTPERFASGLTYQDYIAQIKVNADRFQENYDNTTVSAEAAAKMKQIMARPNGPAKVLVLGEDWCRTSTGACRSSPG